MALMRIRSKLERSDMRVAIIGAGLAGATLAYELNEAEGFEVTIFEKSRGVGGRMSTRYGDSHEYDHGAQFFTLEQNPLPHSSRIWPQQDKSNSGSRKW